MPISEDDGSPVMPGLISRARQSLKGERGGEDRAAPETDTLLLGGKEA
jgi:hypothetical protein